MSAASDSTRRKRAVAQPAGQGFAIRLWQVHGVPHDDMPAGFRAADCLLLSFDWGGSPNVVKEALCAAGRK